MHSVRSLKQPNGPPHRDYAEASGPCRADDVQPSMRIWGCGGVDKLRPLQVIVSCRGLPRATLSACTWRMMRLRRRSDGGGCAFCHCPGADDVLHSSAACHCRVASSDVACVVAGEPVNPGVDWKCNWISCRGSAD